MQFKIEITETLQRIIEVEADSLNDAIIKVCEGYKHGEHILDSEDFVGYEIEEFKE